MISKSKSVYLKRNKKYYQTLILLFLFLFTIISCDTNEPPINRTLSLKLEDVSCTEVWITLTTTNIQLPATITLKKNNLAQNNILCYGDTLLYIDSLFPNQTYSFKASHSGLSGISSKELNVTTMDTTSQNFTFEILEFGDGFSSSYFNDVWIFNPDDIWVCGNVFTNDSTDGNLFHWNGSYWKAHRLNFVDMEGIWGIDTIMYLASGGLWKYDRDTLIRQNIQGNFEPGQAVHKLWGSSKSGIYGVGPWGTIVYYNGVRWAKIDFDAQWYFYDITGNPETGIAYAVALNQSSDCIIVKLKNSIASIFYQQSTSEIKIFSETISESKNFIYIPNDWQNAICRISEKTGTVELIHQINGSFGIEQSSAVSSNDIYYVGPDYTGIGVWIFHFNGISYKKMSIPSIDRDNLGSMHAIKDLAVSVGFTNNKAYLIIIKRS